MTRTFRVEIGPGPTAPDGRFAFTAEQARALCAVGPGGFAFTAEQARALCAVGWSGWASESNATDLRSRTVHWLPLRRLVQMGLAEPVDEREAGVLDPFGRPVYVLTWLGEAAYGSLAEQGGADAC